MRRKRGKAKKVKKVAKEVKQGKVKLHCEKEFTHKFV